LRAAGHTQAEAARIVGVSERTVRNYEKGDRKTTI
jgi:DNA-binding XRE family transcriptional regulator